MLIQIFKIALAVWAIIAILGFGYFLFSKENKEKPVQFFKFMIVTGLMLFVLMVLRAVILRTPESYLVVALVPFGWFISYKQVVFCKSCGTRINRRYQILLPEKCPKCGVAV